MSTVVVTQDPKGPNQISYDERDRQLQEAAAAEELARKKDKESPFGRWTQFNNEHTKELMNLAINYPKAHAILYFLVDQMDNYNACVCSYRVLEEVLGFSRATIARNIKTLKELGFLAVLKSGNSNVFTVNDKVYWKSWGKNRKYSKFPANVILAQSEQDDVSVNFSDLKSEKLKITTKKESGA